MKDNYKGIIDKVSKISNISTKDNSVLYEFSLKDDNIDSTISVIEHSGDKRILDTNNFKIEGKFYNFITPLLKEFSENNDVVFSDFVDINEDNIVTYRLITNNNDQLTIDGLTFEDANYIRDIVSDLKVNNEPKILSLSDNHGKTSIWLIITIIIIIGIIVICSTYFL